MIHLFYVDYVILVGDSPGEIKKIKYLPHNTFKIKDQ